MLLRLVLMLLTIHPGLVFLSTSNTRLIIHYLTSIMHYLTSIILLLLFNRSQVEHTLLEAKFKNKTAIKRQMNETGDSIF